MNKKRVLYSLVSILIICLVIILSKRAIHQRRLYVYCNLLKPGLSLNEVEESLSKIGPHHHRFDYVLERYSYVNFQYGVFKRHVDLGTLGELMFWWDDEGYLMGVSRNVGIGDWESVESCDEYIQDY